MRPREIMSLSTSDSRCGEIFVSNKADKWTFFCSFCQKATSDIGVFICHIRLDHLGGLLDCQSEKENMTPEEEESNFPVLSDSQPMPSLPPGTLLPRDEEQDTNIHLIKEETLSQYSYNSDELPARTSKLVEICSVTDSSETGNAFSAKNSTSTAYPSIEINEEYFTITSRDPDIKQEDSYSTQENHEIVRVLYSKNDEKYEKNMNKTNEETIDNADMEDIYNIDMNSVYSISEDDEEEFIVDDDIDLTSNDDNRASGSKRRKDNRIDMRHSCDSCNMIFKLKTELDNHLKKVHNQKLCDMPLKCKQCRKIFRSVAGYKNHLNAHDERNQKQCPICRATHNQNYFITHVLAHESNTCFPCQVCGKIFPNNDERMKHWRTHAKDKPYACDSCYRRFRQKHFLIHHLKKHGQYKCYFCPEKFVTTQTPRPPYVCPKCERLPDIGQKIEHHKYFSNRSFIYESDEENSTASIKKPASIDSDAEKKRCHLAQENRESEIKAEADGFASTKSKNLVTQTTYLPEQENVLENRESEIKNETDEFVSTKSRDPVTEAHYLHVEPEKSDIDSIQSKSNEEINKIVSITVVQPEIEIKQENPAIGEETNDESITIDDDENFNNTDASSVHTTINEDNVTTNEDDIDMENKDYNKASGSRSEEEVLVHKCGLCDLKFVSAKTVTDHLEFSHAIVETEMRYECKECGKKFRNLSGLRYHLQTHHKVAVCQVPLRKYYFMTHILAHQPHHLITRLKPAPQYVCQYCQTPNEVGTQNAPYICTNCGSSPKKYRPSEDSIPKAQIKTSKPLGKNLYK